MRVCILGPILNDKLSGGVGTYDEGLARGFIERGDQVELISLAKSSSFDNCVIGNGKNNLKTIYFKYGKIGRAIKDFKADLVISSLQYSIGIKKYKRMNPNTKFVQILHGYPCPINGKKKAWEINTVARYARKHFDFVVTVCYLSWAINEKINLVHCDAVIPCGSTLVAAEENDQRKYDLVYVGRLFRDKRVDLICDAFLKLCKKYPNLKMAVAGGGEQADLFTNGRFKDPHIDYFGLVNHSKVNEIFQSSRFFISMNELEPFGTVFLEAVTQGCNILMPYTGGPVEYLGKADYTHFVDYTSVDNVANSIEEVLPKYRKISKAEEESYVDAFSYKKIAQRFIDLVFPKV
jgi:glycosyltransferase involved in cell wall biosynthesis